MERDKDGPAIDAIGPMSFSRGTLSLVRIWNAHGDEAGGVAPVLHDLGAEGFADSLIRSHAPMR